MKKWKKLVNLSCALGAALVLVASCGQKENAGSQSAADISSETSAENEEKKPADKGTPTLLEVSAMDAMCAPNGIAAMPDGALLITDTYHKRVWQVKDGATEVFAGGDTVIGLYGEPMGGYNDGDLQSSYFQSPWDVTPFLEGWAVSDTENNVVRLIRGQQVQTLNGRTEEQLETSDKGVVFNRPTGLATDSDGNLYVADTDNGAVRKVSPQGLVTTVAEGLKDPMGLCWQDGVLYVAEAGENRIVTVKDGRTETLAGSGQEGLKDGSANEAEFAAPRDVAIGEDGALYVADTLNSAIRRIQDGQVDTLVARDAAQAQFGLTSPSGLLVQGERIYICDNFSRKLFVLEWEK